MATATNDKPVRLGDLPVIKTNILENARQYDKGIIGGYNGAFPLTAATKGNIYLLPGTNKFYMCITDYNGSNLTAPNANFEELSVWANRDKLENLGKKLILKIPQKDSSFRKFEIYDELIKKADLIEFAYGVVSSSEMTILPISLNRKNNKYITVITLETNKGVALDVQFQYDLGKIVFGTTSSLDKYIRCHLFSDIYCYKSNL